MNDMQQVKRVKVGTYLGDYYKVEMLPEEKKVIIITELHNDLVAPPINLPSEGDRHVKLRQLLEQSSWGHLTSNQKQLLFETILKHDEAFILNQDELGKTNLPPAVIT